MLTHAEKIKLILQEQANAPEKKESLNEFENRISKNKRISNYYDKLDSIQENKAKKSIFCENLRKSLLSDALVYLFEKSTPKSIMHTNRANELRRNLVNKYINENGTLSLLYEFKHKSYLLSEMSRIVEESYDNIMEKTKDYTDNYTIDMNDKKAFYDSLDYIDMDEVADAIRHRVGITIEDFIDSNNRTAAEIKEIITANDEKVNSSNDTYREEYNMIAKKKIDDLQYNRRTNILENMINRLSRASLSNEDLKNLYFKENSLDMDILVEDCEITYTFLEMLNSAKIKRIDSKYLLETLNNLG